MNPFEVGAFKMKSVQSGLFEFISIQVKLLKFCGFWFLIPYKTMSWKCILSILQKAVFGFFIFILPQVGQVLHLLTIIKSREAQILDIASKVNLVLMESMISVQLLDYCCRRQQLKNIIKQLKIEEFSHKALEQKKIINKRILISRKISLTMYIVSTIDFIIHAFFITGWNGFKTLPVDMNFLIVDVNEYPIFIYVFVYQIIYKSFLIAIYISLQTMRWSFMVCAITQLDLFIHNFKNINVDEKVEDFQNIFNKSVRHHCAIISFVNDIENVFGGQILSFFILTACVMCTTLLQVVSTANVMDILWIFGFLITLTSMLYIDCYFGSAITEKSAQISTVMYCYPWMVLPQKLKTNFIIVNNQRPLEIKAGKLIPVSILSFTKVMNWTYQGFALFNQMKN